MQCARDRENNLMSGEEAVLVTNIERLRYPEGNTNKYMDPQKLRGTGERKSGIYSEYIGNNNEVFNIFVSRATKEILPRHFREYRSYNIITQGKPSAGKTMDLMQKTVELPKLLAREKIGITFAQDSNEKVVPQGFKENKKRYLEGFLPEPTPDTGLQNIHFWYKYGGKGALLNFIDVPGEADPTVRESLFRYADTVWFYIDGDSINNSIQMAETEERLQALLVQLGDKAKGITASIIVTKADVCWKNRKNTLQKDENGATYLVTHKCRDGNGGYQMEAHKARCKEVEAMLGEKEPALVQLLNDSFGEVAYFAIAGTNCKCKDPLNRIPEEAEMFRVEEPLLYWLTQMKLYPQATPKKQENQGNFVGNLRKLWDILNS